SRESAARLHSLSAVSKPSLRPACRDGPAQPALALSGVGGPPSRRRDYARQRGGCVARTRVLIRPEIVNRLSGDSTRSCVIRRGSLVRIQSPRPLVLGPEYGVTYLSGTTEFRVPLGRQPLRHLVRFR